MKGITVEQLELYRGLLPDAGLDKLIESVKQQ